MKPSRSSRRRRPPTGQLTLPLEAPRIVALDTTARAGLVGLVARLLVEAARPAREPEGAHEAS